MSPLRQIYESLLAHFGPLHGPEASSPWWPIFSDEPQLEVLVGAVLVQQTRWEAVEAAVIRLRDAGLLGVDALAEADPATLAALIRPAAFHTQKAPGLIAIARHIQGRYGGSLRRMLDQPTATLRAELLALPRIGPETCDVIMLYAGGHPVFVVDEYTRRLLERVAPAMPKAKGERHKAGPWRAPYDQLRGAIEVELSSSGQDQDSDASFISHPSSFLFAEFHAQINEQCVRYCLSRPRCDGPPARRVYSRQDGRASYHERHDGCPLRAVCAFYKSSS